MEKITVENYFLNTCGKWKFIKEYERNDVISWSKYSGFKTINKNDLCYLISKATGIPIYELEWNYSSFNTFWKTGSFYAYHSISKTLFRLSDHWSHSNHPNVKTCNSIRSCWWELQVNKKDYNKVIGLKKRCKYYNYQLAKIKLNKLENRKY